MPLFEKFNTFNVISILGKSLKLLQSSSTFRILSISFIKEVGPPIIDVPESIIAFYILSK